MPGSSALPGPRRSRSRVVIWPDKEDTQGMPLYRHADRLLLLIHIPKTGGSTVEEVLRRRGAKQALKARPRPEFATTTPQHMHWDLLRAWVPPSFYDQSVAVVRNPYTRLVSEYRWRSDLHRAGQQNRLATATTLSAASLTPMPNFRRWVQRQFKDYAQRPSLLDNHIRPQVDFVGPDCQTFRLEDGLETAIRSCLTYLNMPLNNLRIHRARKSAPQPI